MWLLVFGGYAVGIVANNSQEADARHEAVCAVRLAFTDLYDFIEELRGPSAELTEVRARLDRVLPDDDC